MKIEQIDLENYRNIGQISVHFDDINVIYGENAQGKTNLLEAIYLFTGAKSFRGAKDSELIRFGCKKANLSMRFVSGAREQKALLTIENKRQAVLNGVKKSSTAELGDALKAVVFSPVHLSMIKDGPAERRKFLDGALCQIKSGYRGILRTYNRCLTQRNTLLKDIGKNAGLLDLLDIWDQRLAAAGAKILFQREKYVEAILPYAADIFAGLSGGKEKIGLQIGDGENQRIRTVVEFEEQLLSQMIKNRQYDVTNHTTSNGPHRDDLTITINEKSARTYGSQGQQRSCVLALKLAEASLLKELTQEEPVALLDDVMSELDEKRQDYILNRMKERQIFITCCDANTVLRSKKGKLFHIENGGLL